MLRCTDVMMIIQQVECCRLSLKSLELMMWVTVMIMVHDTL